MANTSMKPCVTGYCVVNITVNGRNYKDFRFNVMKDLCSDIILGYDFQNMHKRLIIELSGSKSDLVIENNTTLCALSVASVGEPSLFANLLPNCKPIATKPRRFGLQDREFMLFIQSEVNRLLADGIIETSTSPWRAQVVVVKTTGKQRLCVDYLQTINLCTELDAYQLPCIDDMINKLAKYKYF